MSKLQGKRTQMAVGKLLRRPFKECKTRTRTCKSSPCTRQVHSSLSVNENMQQYSHPLKAVQSAEFFTLQMDHRQVSVRLTQQYGHVVFSDAECANVWQSGFHTAETQKQTSNLKMTGRKGEGVISGCHMTQESVIIPYTRSSSMACLGLASVFTLHTNLLYIRSILT